MPEFHPVEKLKEANPAQSLGLCNIHRSILTDHAVPKGMAHRKLHSAFQMELKFVSFQIAKHIFDFATEGLLNRPAELPTVMHETEVKATQKQINRKLTLR